MDRVSRLRALLLLCVLGAARAWNEAGLRPVWSPVREERGVPETSAAPPASAPSPNPWTDGQKDGTLHPDSGRDFTYQLFLLFLGVFSFACLGCWCSWFLNWLASYLDYKMTEDILVTITCPGYGTFVDMAPQGPDSEGDQATLLLQAPSTEPPRLEQMPVRPEQATGPPQR